MIQGTKDIHTRAESTTLKKRETNGRLFYIERVLINHWSFTVSVPKLWQGDDFKQTSTSENSSQDWAPTQMWSLQLCKDYNLCSALPCLHTVIFRSPIREEIWRPTRKNTSQKLPVFNKDWFVWNCSLFKKVNTIRETLPSLLFVNWEIPPFLVFQ